MEDEGDVCDGDEEGLGGGGGKVQAWGDCITGRGAEARAAGTEWGKGGEAGARRIVILSNVLRCFCVADVPPRPGDLFLHINHAVHQAAAMASAGCFHWLYVRHGGARGSGWKWHTPPSRDAFEGFQRVTFLDSRFPISPFPWYHAYRAAGAARSSPPDWAGSPARRNCKKRPANLQNQTDFSNLSLPFFLTWIVAVQGKILVFEKGDCMVLLDKGKMTIKKKLIALEDSDSR